MALNRETVARAVTFMKYLASLVALIFLQKFIIWNKTMFWLSNLLNLAELVVNELTKSKLIYHQLCKIHLSLLIAKNSGVPNLHLYSLLLIMTCRYSSFESEGS